MLVRLDVPVVIGLSSLVTLLGANGQISQLEGVFLVAMLGVYLAVLIGMERRAPHPGPPEAARAGRHGARPVVVDGLLIVGGLALLVVGSRFLIDGAVELARALGLSELVIGLTIVAGGTSMPELATSIIASVRRQQDIAVGNILGSNVFNLLMVLGGAAALVPGGIPIPPAALTFDMPVMIAVAVACLPVFFGSLKISRWEGAVFVLYYIAYVIFLVLDATSHEAAPVFSLIMLAYVVPLTVLTFSIVLVRHRGSDDGSPGG